MSATTADTRSERICGAEPTLYSLTIVRRSWHGGIFLSTAHLPPELKQIAPEFRDFPYVELGWGDRDFYMGKPGISSGPKALFFSDASVLHVVGFRTGVSPDDIAVTVFLGRAGYQKLTAAIAASFSISAEGEASPLGPSQYGEGHFYPAQGEFSIRNTCNTWTARLLREGGCDIEPPITVSRLFAKLQLLPVKPSAER